MNVYSADVAPPVVLRRPRGRQRVYPLDQLTVGSWFTFTRPYPEDGDMESLCKRIDNSLRSCARNVGIRIKLSSGIDTDSTDVRFTVTRAE